jgi:hypothetical protein
MLLQNILDALAIVIVLFRPFEVQAALLFCDGLKRRSRPASPVCPLMMGDVTVITAHATPGCRPAQCRNVTRRFSPSAPWLRRQHW